MPGGWPVAGPGARRSTLVQDPRSVLGSVLIHGGAPGVVSTGFQSKPRLEQQADTLDRRGARSPSRMGSRLALLLEDGPNAKLWHPTSTSHEHEEKKRMSS